MDSLYCGCVPAHTVALGIKSKNGRWFLGHLGVVEAVSIIVFTLVGYPLAGIIGPIWGIALPFFLPWDYAHGYMTPQMAGALILPAAVIILLTVVTLAALTGRLAMWVGHLAFGIYNVLSTVLLLGLE